MDRKTVLITGGAMGQGRQHALKYAEEGYDIIVGDMLDPESPKFKEMIEMVEEKGASVYAQKCNIASSEDMEALFKGAWDKFGRIDVVIANAGTICYGLTWEHTDEDVQRVMDVNVIGTWRTNKLAVQYMLKQGDGRIINISSTAGLRGSSYIVAYTMSKYGVIGLTKTVAKELQDMGSTITVNAICPTKVETPMCESPAYLDYMNKLTHNHFTNAEEMYRILSEKRNGLAAFLKPEEVSNMCFWMGNSSEAKKMNGQAIPFEMGVTL